MELKQINQVCEINPRASEISDLPADLVVSFVPMEDVPLPRIEFNPYKTKTLDEVRKKYTYFKNGDIILAKVTPCFENGKIAIANNLVNGIGFGSSELYVIRCSDKIDNKYLFYILQSNKFLQEGTNTLSGTSGLLRVPRKFIEEFEIPLPSLEIQKQIVAECETVETRQRELLAQNLAEKDQLKRLRESLLNKAISGQLVPQIEAEGSAEELYQQIQASRPPLKKGISPVLSTEIPFSIPKSWKWVRLGEVFDVRDGTHDTPKYVSTGFPLLTSKNLSSFGFNLNEVKYISQEDHSQISQRSKVEIGDILFAMIGTIGNPVINNLKFEYSIKNVALFKTSNNILSNKYLFYYLTYSVEIMKQQSGGGVQSFVSLGYLRSFLFPLPPLAEQARIVSAVEVEMTKIQSLETLNQENHTLISKMLNQFIRERIG